jgi:hypothetical protein
MVLEAFSSSLSHGKASAYLPVIDLLSNYFRTASAGILPAWAENLFRVGLPAGAR